MKTGPKPFTIEMVLARIFERLGPEPSDPDECWEWPGGQTSKGYGTVQARGVSKQPLLVHRLVYATRDPSLTDDEEVLHDCDNPPCVRHLRKGTHMENMRDAKHKGRLKIGGRTGGTWVKGGGRVKDATHRLPGKELLEVIARNDQMGR